VAGQESMDGENMPNYGLRLVGVELHKGRAWKTLEDFGDVDGTDYLDVVVGDLADAARSDPTADDDQENGDESGDGPESLPAVLRVEAVQRLKAAILLTVRYGMVGDHDKAVHPLGKRADQDLTGLATTRRYRAVLITPPTGTQGILAVESVGRSHPTQSIPKLLRSKNAGQWGIRTRATVADEAAVNQLKQNGSAGQVHLYRYTPGSDSARGRRPKEIDVTVNLGGDDKLSKKLLEQVSSWVNLPGKDKINAKHEAQAVAAIVWQEAKDLPFDNTSVSVRLGNRSKTLRPLDASQGFVYDLGPVRLDDDDFISEVSETVQPLLASLDMDMPQGWNQPYTKPKA
jgi:hypothetical protein